MDTSVIGGCFDDEFSEYSNQLFECFRKDYYIPVISDAVTYELEQAQQKVKANLINLIEIAQIETTQEMRSLAKKYIAEKIVTEKYADDALHIAIATVAKIDVLVSWNFKHIVNLNKIHLFNGINMKEGYSLLEIRTPMEVLNDEE